MHKKVKELAGLGRSSSGPGKITDKEGNYILYLEQKLVRWRQYLGELFADDKPRGHARVEAITGPSITADEVAKAIRQARNGKAVGPDEIPTEVVKWFGGKAVGVMTELFNLIYDTGVIPKDWLRSTFIALPKKPNAKECCEYRTVSLMSHVLKIFLRVIHERMRNKAEEYIGDTQFGFRQGLGTREGLFSIQVLVQRCRDMNCDVYLCFIDFEKAFDRVRHSHMINILKSIGMDDKDVRFIANL